MGSLRTWTRSSSALSCQVSRRTWTRPLFLLLWQAIRRTLTWPFSTLAWWKNRRTRTWSQSFMMNLWTRSQNSALGKDNSVGCCPFMSSLRIAPGHVGGGRRTWTRPLSVLSWLASRRTLTWPSSTLSRQKIRKTRTHTLSLWANSRTLTWPSSTFSWGGGSRRTWT